MTGAKPINIITPEDQLQLTGNCVCKPSGESANTNVLYTSKITESNRRAHGERKCLENISQHICSDKHIEFKATEIKKYAKDRLP